GAPDEERTPLFASQIIMDLYGHHWTLAFQTTPAFEALETAVDRYTASGILAAGVLLSFVVFFSLRLLESTGDQALGLARKMTSALRESEQKYRFLTENISDVIWTTDLEGRLTYIGLANERMTGFTPEELMGMPMHDYVIPEDYAIVMEIVAEELAKPPAERSSSMIIPIRLKTKDNRLVHAELSAAWLLDEQGNTIGFQGSTRDITERKQAEQERAISLYTRNLIEVNLDPIVTISADGKITDVNKAAEEITGVSRTELIGSDFSGYFTEPEKAQEGYELAFRQGRVRDYPLTIHHSSGRNTDVLYNASVYRDETGEVQGVFAAARDMTESKMAKKMRERLRQVQALRNIDTTITGSLDLGVTFQVILDEITGMLNIDAVAILTLDSYTNTLKYDTWRGFSTKNLKNISLPLSEGYISRAVMEHQSIYIPDLRAAEPDPIQGSLNDKEGFVAHYAVPLIAKGTVRGLLQIFNRAPFEPDEEWFSFLETMAGQAAIAIDNAELFHRLERSNVGLLRAYDATIAGWAFALDLKDDETGEHSRRVTEMTLSIAREMGMESEQLAHIQRGALLHDIGKMGIPDKILLKPGPLTDNEWEIMRKHPRHAYNMLLPIDYLRPAMEIPYCHHEKFDGSGYPRGLKGEQIPLAARIFAVVDVFDALTSERPYRAAWSKEGALDYIKQQSSKHFDPQVVAVFLDMINNTD
ncbi:MAG TPA: HD domain-containing phosphohydrolase, partial [Candidatus Limnocylindrales bacterium]|nr:HD domain-containing phosphohydrolase [Candidatus Limnocylindrales bacterium]